MTAAPPASISDQVDELQAAFADRAPADARAAFAANVAELRRGGVPAGVAKPGKPLDDAGLIDAHGQPTSLAAAAAGRPAVLVFYRGAWCPYCNLVLRTYGQQLRAPLLDRGVGLVAISPQKPDGSLSMQEKHDLAFPVLSDPGNALAGQLGVIAAPAGDAVIAAQRNLGVDVAAGNADGTATLPMRTIAFVDEQRTIRWIDVRPDYTSPAEVDEILAGVDAAL